jgi:hypothetical protein
MIIAGSAVNIWFMRKQFDTDLKKLVKPETLSAVKEDIRVIENSVNTNIAAKTSFIDLFGYVQVLLDKKEMSDLAQVRSEIGSLVYGSAFPVDVSQSEKYARRVASLKKAAGEAKVLFVSPPSIIIKGFTKFEKGLPFHDYNVMQDAFHYYLRQYGIDYLDARYTLPFHDELPIEKYIYKTDHHWTIEASFAVFQDLVTELNQRYEAGLDPDGFYRNRANYDSKTIPNSFLGSLGRNTGVVFSGLEEMTLIWPTFDSYYTVEMIDYLQRYIKRSGPAENSLLYSSALSGSNPYLMLAYNYYLSAISAWVKIINHENPDGPKLLMVHDSYSQPLACFLAPLFSEIHMIWPLADNPVQVEKYLADTHFDYVIVELYSGNLKDEGVHFFLEADNKPLTVSKLSD